MDFRPDPELEAFRATVREFVARNLPPKLILFGIAAYALDIVATSHLSTLLRGQPLGAT